MTALYILCFIAAVWVARPAACAAPLVDLDAEIKAAVESCGQQPGVAVAMISRNETLGSFTYAKGFGLRDIEHNLKADDNTLFCMASITKHVTATLLVHLLDLHRSSGHEKRYGLQTLITELDPGLAFAGSQLSNVTLEDAVTHRTGLSDSYGPLIYGGYSGNFGHRDLAYVTAKLDRLAPPGQKYMYNNHVYALAGYASEILGSIIHGRNVSWEELTKIHLLDKLGITNDVEFVQPLGTGDGERIAHAYITIGGKSVRVPAENREVLRAMSSAGGMCISPKGMAIWMEFLMNKGAHGQPVVQPEVIEETWKPRMYLYGDHQYYGLGWLVTTTGEVNTKHSRTSVSVFAVDARYASGRFPAALGEGLQVARLMEWLGRGSLKGTTINEKFLRGISLFLVRKDRQGSYTVQKDGQMDDASNDAHLGYMQHPGSLRKALQKKTLKDNQACCDWNFYANQSS